MKFLIVKSSSLGDIIHAFPVADYLRKRFPDSEIDWVVEKGCSELVYSNPQVSHTIQVDTKKWRKGRNLSDFYKFLNILRSKTYDVIFDLQGNTKSGLITFFAKGNHKVGFAKESVPEKPNLLFTDSRFNPPPNQNIREDYLSIIQQYFKDTTSFVFDGVSLSISPDERVTVKHKFPVLVSPGSNWKNKQLSQGALIQFLHNYHAETDCHFYFSWGSPQEKQLSQGLVEEFTDHGTLLDQMKLPVLQDFMSQMKLVVAMDSLPLHLAATTKVATYSIFGPSSAKKYAPIGAQHLSFQGKCPYGKTFEKRCPILRTCKTGACIRSLTADDLGNA